MPFPANPLEATLAGVRAGTVSADGLLAALGTHPLWVPLPGGADPHGHAQLPVVVQDGRPYVVVYTSAEQYARGAGVQAHMTIVGAELAGLMADELGFAVNPGAELGLPIHAEGIRVLRGGRRTVRAGERLRLGAPAEEPHELITALAGRFAATPAVLEARHALAQIGDEPPVLLVGIRVDQRVSTWQRDSVTAVSDAVRQSTAPYPVETVFLADRADLITAWMLEHTEPIYQDPAAAGPTGLASRQ